MSSLNFLIIRQDRIGDVVLSTSLPRELKRTYPNCNIFVLVRDYTKDIYLNNNNIKEVIILHDDISTFKLAKLLRSYKIDVSFSILPNGKICYALFLAGIKIKVGSGFKLYQFITNTKSVHRRKYVEHRHEADYSADLIRKIGVEVESFASEINLSESEKTEVISIKQKYGSKFLIAINVSSGGSAPNLTLEAYKQIVKELKKLEGVELFISDNILSDKIKDEDGIIFLNENLPLRKSIINIAAMDLFISSSTGPMHIAAALGVRTLSFFCPLPACHPSLWGPLGNLQEVILPETEYCKTQCPGDPKICKFEGSKTLSAENILSVIKSIIKL